MFATYQRDLLKDMFRAHPHLCDPIPCDPVSPPDQDIARAKDFAELRPYEISSWADAWWRTLDSAARSLPDELDEHEFCTFKLFLMLSARYLPCGDCSTHFERAVSEIPNNALSRTRGGLLMWLSDTQSNVRRRQGRETLSHDEIIAAMNARASGGAAAAAAAAVPPAREKKRSRYMIAGVALAGGLVLGAVAGDALRHRRKRA